jgi:hypothetical protein
MPGVKPDREELGERFRTRPQVGPAAVGSFGEGAGPFPAAGSPEGSTVQIRSRTFAGRFVAAAAMAFAGMTTIQPLAVFALRWLPEGAARPALAWTIAAALVGAGAAFAPSGRRGLAVGACAGLAGAVALGAWTAGGWIPGLALVPLGALLAAGAERLERRLPDGLDDRVARRRWLAVAWALFAVASLVSTARLAAFAGDSSRGFVVGTDNPFWYGHLCLPAYLHGAELALAREENLYAASHWPSLDPQAAPESRFAGMKIEDPYQYPPQFLLLPALGVALTARWDLLLAGWFTLNAGLFVAAYVGLARWIGGRSGATALWLLPLVAMAFPVLYNFQFGQFHLAAISLALFGMMALDRGRRLAGGFLVAGAIVAKVFPVLLVAWLVGRRRLRDAGAVILAGAALTAAALAVFGPAPFVAFVDYQLPRLGDGTAFAFDEAWPEVAEMVIADNQGIFGLARKLGASKPAAATAGRIFALLLGLAAVGLGALRRQRNELELAWLWLALLGLGSMASPGAWGDYVPSVAIWLLAFVAARGAASARLAAALGVAGLFQYVLLGTFPWTPSVWGYLLSGIGVVGLLALYAGTIVAVARPRAPGSSLERSLAGWAPSDVA